MPERNWGHFQINLCPSSKASIQHYSRVWYMFSTSICSSKYIFAFKVPSLPNPPLPAYGFTPAARTLCRRFVCVSEFTYETHRLAMYVPNSKSIQTWQLHNTKVFQDSRLEIPQNRLGISIILTRLLFKPCSVRTVLPTQRAQLNSRTLRLIILSVITHEPNIELS